MEALHEAIKVVGSRVGLAAELGVTHQAITNWFAIGKIPVRPVNRVLEIERLTGVSRHELAPDVYPD